MRVFHEKIEDYRIAKLQQHGEDNVDDDETKKEDSTTGHNKDAVHYPGEQGELF